MEVSFPFGPSHQMRLSLDPVSHQLRFLVISNQTGETLSFAAADHIADAYLFHKGTRMTSRSVPEGAEIRLDTWCEGSERDVRHNDVTYTFLVGKDQPVLQVEGRIHVRHPYPVSEPIRWEHLPSKYAVPVIWMGLSFPEQTFMDFHGFGDELKGPLSTMDRPVSFTDGLVLSGAAWQVGTFDSGHIRYDPKTCFLLPDSEYKMVQPDWFDQILTATIVFGDIAAEPYGMREAAERWASCASVSRKRAAVPEQDQDQAACGSFLFEQEQPVRCETIPLPLGDSLWAGIRLSAHHAVVYGAESTDAGRPDIRILPAPLFGLSLRRLADDVRVEVTSADWWESIDAITREGYHQVRFHNPLKESISGIAVTVTVRETERKGLAWQVRVHNRRDDFTVLGAAYPSLRFQAEAFDLFLPEFSGSVAEGAERINTHRNAYYPAGIGFTMPCFGVYNQHRRNGLYYAVHDPAGALKRFGVNTCRKTREGLFSCAFPGIGVGLGENSFELAGEMVWERFDGDWYDVAQRYRAFALTKASWLPPVNEKGRMDTPEWMKQVPFWIMDWMPNTNPAADPVPTSIRPVGTVVADDAWVEEALQLQRELDVPIGYHLYNWHWIPFNNDFPHYFPVKEGFGEGVARLQAQKVHVMPYINGRLWDTCDKAGEDWQFSSRARRWAVKAEDGSLRIETYESHEPDGSVCRLAAMCPSTPLWREVMAQTISRLFGEYGVDGVYLDQIGARHPDACTDVSHPHPPGGGDWWIRSYEALLSQAMLGKPARGMFSTEDNAETYMRHLDGFLTWTWIQDRHVPAFPAVYAGYVAMMGRNTNGVKRTDDGYVRWHIAQQLLYGQQIGWINADVRRFPNQFAFLKKVVHLRYESAAFFCRGCLLRPPQVADDAGTRTTVSGMRLTKTFSYRHVLSGAWRMWDNTGARLFILNCADHAATFVITADAGEYGIRDAGALVKVDGEGEINTVRLLEGCKIQMQGHLPAQSLLALDWTPACDEERGKEAEG